MTAPPFPAAAIAAARNATRAHLRGTSARDDPALDTMAASSLALAEAFTGVALIARDWTATIQADGAWQSLRVTPVRAIQAVERLATEGAAVPVAVEAHAIDIDADGTGWVRVARSAGTTLAQVRFVAGLTSEWSGLPAPVAQGVVLLAAHLFNVGDGTAAPPAAVAALWRPYRRMRLEGDRR